MSAGGFLALFCSIDLLSGGVGRASLPCRIISRRRTRSWTNALVDASSRGRMLSDPTHTLDRSSQRRSWTRSISLSYDFLLTNALLAQIEQPRSLMPNSVQLSQNREESLMPICVNCRGIARNRANALILFVANPVPVPVLISNALILFVSNPVPVPVLICA